MSGSGQKSESESTSVTRDLTPEEFKGLRPEIRDAFSFLLSQATSDFSDSGPFVAPIGAEEQAALDAVNTTPTALESASEAAILRRLDPNRFRDIGSDPITQGVIEAATRPVIEAFNEQELLDRALFTRAGQKLPESSPFSRARAIATRGLTNTIGDIASRVVFGERERRGEEETQAIAAAAAKATADFGKKVEVLKAKALPRVVEQFGLDKGREIFNDRLNTLKEILGVAGAIASPTLGSFSSGSSISVGGSAAVKGGSGD